MIPPILSSTALSGLEDAVNRALQLDPSSGAKLAQLDGERFALELLEPDLNLGLVVSGSRLKLMLEAPTPASTALRGRWSEFATVASAKDPGAALINGNIQVSGDTAPLLALRKLLAELELDWEQPLADTFGDIAAHQIGRGLRAGHKWLRHTGKNLRRQLGDFLLEESRLLPHPLQAEALFRDIDAVSARSERLEAKLRRLQQRLKP
ncbi:SCP2 domain-containing protein [Spongiibacter sp.]|uniref:ubiquinone biosynthesis accessory factor UbiJ n=1 Tax=Spongiibacter sp. TaxID=2024860 RepID=UPI00356573BB